MIKHIAGGRENLGTHQSQCPIHFRRLRRVRTRQDDHGGSASFKGWKEDPERHHEVHGASNQKRQKLHLHGEPVLPRIRSRRNCNQIVFDLSRLLKRSRSRIFVHPLLKGPDLDETRAREKKRRKHSNIVNIPIQLICPPGKSIIFYVIS